MGQYNTSLTAKNRGDRDYPVSFIVLHDTAGSRGPGDAKYLANDPDKRGVSVDFCIMPEGTIYQLNPDLRNRCTYHAGRATSFRGYRNGVVNHRSIGIEISQKAKIELVPDPKYPDAQVKAVADVCRDICTQFNLTSKDITTHKAIITDGSRSDPRLFPWDKFWAYFSASGQLNEVSHEVAPSEVTHLVVEGDTLWSLANKYQTTIEQLKAQNGMNAMSNMIVVGTELRVK